ncbi:MBL fold metallo-hydrolase [Pseudosporangium ferrugineum]|uniref:Glyoxylase-like metal-dependent hydrolase (Beta-lactamase superfamily II) n=1 Tax=Pseudosporangium ferrugineum TaxID=439699 RepID=A0A2T0S414_9ACTN|nr:MBL fold metallo-hydrolase [Pseudosporangium ferrugineum]PRY28122.1 glyoxylase-like metal-dependent hydrolase (beta-lactamase superfamily II) [Pseudosporangium ferrugineum]
MTAATTRFGPVTVIALDDAEGPHFDLREDAFPDATPEDWAAADALDPGSLTADGRWWLRFRSFAVRHGDGGPVVLVDAGIGPAGSPAADWAPVPGRLPEALAEAGIGAEEVSTIVLTHLHTDHIGWAVPGDSPLRNARVVVQRADVTAYERAAPSAVQDEVLLKPLREQGRLEVVEGDVRLSPEVRIVSTPGHTPGHQSVLVESGDDSLLVTGDLLVHAVQLVRPELAYGHDMDAELARRSRMAALEGAASRGSLLGVSHLGTAWSRTSAGRSWGAADPDRRKG